MPGLETTVAKGKTAVLTDGQKIGTVEIGFLPLFVAMVFLFVVGFWIGNIGKVQTRGLLVLLRPSCSIAPLAWAIDGVLVGLELCLVLQGDVPLHCFLSKAYL